MSSSLSFPQFPISNIQQNKKSKVSNPQRTFHLEAPTINQNIDFSTKQNIYQIENEPTTTNHTNSNRQAVFRHPINSNSSDSYQILIKSHQKIHDQSNLKPS